MPRNTAAWFHASVQVVDKDFYVPRWLVHDALAIRYPADLPPIKFDVAVDAKRQILVLQPFLTARGAKLRETEYKACATRYPSFLRVRLDVIAEIFQVKSPARYPVMVSRKDAAIFVKMRKAQEPSPCIK